jgi:putative transposase
MIEPNLSGLSVSKQCALLSISRSSFYYEPKGESEMNLDLMRLIDKQFLETPLYGVRQPLGTLPSAIPLRPMDDMAFAQ